ncbi:MAG TPA: SAM-dependent methyltransferase [Natronosporangium sp.]
MTEQPPSKQIDTSVPHSARIWNYWLGGNDNYAVDRAAGDRYREINPGIVETARASRAFIGRAVRYLVGEAGLRQLLDIGTGLPTVDNTHEIAQRVAPECRIVYVDNDPLVLAHARALLTSTPEGRTDYIDADAREPEQIVRAARELLDLSKPVGLMFMGMLAHIADYDQARSVVRHILAALPSGSYLAIYDGVNTNPASIEAQKNYQSTGAVPYVLRTPEQIAGFFEGLELVEPGVVTITRWRPDGPVTIPDRPAFGGVARKP